MQETVIQICKKYKKWNQSLAPACLGKGAIRYQFRLHSIVTNSTAQGNQTMDFFKVFEYQVGIKSYILIKCSRVVFGALNKVPI